MILVACQEDSLIL